MQFEMKCFGRLFFLGAILAGIVSADYVIQIPQGKVQGVLKKSFGGKPFLSFEGIPFAKPPLGELRFEAPQPAGKWNGTLTADKSYSCLQYIPIPMIGFSMGSEDCLYLYVYVPRSKIAGDENLDVIAYIHGGGFMFGDPVSLAGPDYMMDKDVIFVSFNYRLSILGFLSTEDNVVPGNNGLKDQVMALKWIQNNIKYFGGNPNSVTLYGLSAGGVSTHLHYLSPLSKGLFHRGFSQSGSSLLPWAIHKKPLQKAKSIAAHFSCPIKSRRRMIECLKKQDAKDLTSSTKILTVFMDNVPGALFGPVVEKGYDAFLDVHPYQLLKEGKVYDVPWVASNVHDEGIFPVNLIAGLQIWDKVDNWTFLMPYFIELQDAVDKKDLVNVSLSIRHFYFNDEPLSEKHVYNMVKLFTDRMYKIDSEKAVRLHASAVKSPVYYMLFSYEVLQPLLIPGMPRLKGVGHGDDSTMYAPISVMGEKHLVAGRDIELMHICTNFIDSYAKGQYGSFNNVKWTPVTPGEKDLNVLLISSPTDIRMKKFQELAPQKFWGSLPIHENEKLTVKYI